MNKIKIPKIPRCISGLKKDGTRDRRFKKQTTYAEMKEFLDKTAGLSYIVKVEKDK